MIWFKRLLFFAALLIFPRLAAAADLTIQPPTAQTAVGSTMTATIEVDTGETAINAVETTITFPTDLLKLIAVSKVNSILALATVDSAEANTTGQITVSGGLPSPGFAGQDGTILKVTWEARAAGVAVIHLIGGKILANDGQGTNILKDQTGASVTITGLGATNPTVQPPVVGALEYPNEQAWYSGSDVTIFWTQPAGLTGVSYVLNRQPDTRPDEIVDATGSSTVVSLTEDGVWYFHLRGKYGSGWSEPVQFILRRDATPPAAFEIEVVRDRGAADPSPDIIFMTSDGGSGLAGYTASINGDPAKTTTSPFKIIATRSGDYQVVVTATDRAGNIRVSATTFSIAGYTVPTITSISTPLILLEKLIVRGTALAGDRVNIFIDGQLVGSTTAGPPTVAVTDGTTVRLPWSYTTDQSFGPGPHRVTATATSPTQQTSVASDPRQFVVRGSHIQFGGRTLGTFAVAPLVGFGLVLMMMAITWLVWRLRQSVVEFEARQTMVDQDVRTLRRAIDQGQLSTQGIEDALTIIDDEVTGRRPPRRSTKRRVTKKRS